MTREEAATRIKDHIEIHRYHERNTVKIFEALDMAIEALRQPEIVVCKDCKNSEHWYRDRRRCFLWSEDGVSVFDDGFCNYAERRTDDQERIVDNNRACG